MTGRPAQFGRSLLPEVSGKLIAQFASNLEALIASDSAAADRRGDRHPRGRRDGGRLFRRGGDRPGRQARPRPGDQAGRALNAFKFVVVPILKRVIPVAAIGAAIAVAIRRLDQQEEVVLAAQPPCV